MLSNPFSKTSYRVRILRQGRFIGEKENQCSCHNTMTQKKHEAYDFRAKSFQTPAMKKTYNKATLKYGT
ncbi:hypothetical protein ACHQM5_006209 [Ranunculus cassubicifolius]